VRVAAEEQRAVDPLRLAVAAHRLADREHVRLVERARGRGPAVTGGAERDELRRVRRVGPLVVVGGDEPVDVHERRLVGPPPREITHRHCDSPLRWVWTRTPAAAKAAGARCSSGYAPCAPWSLLGSNAPVMIATPRSSVATPGRRFGCLTPGAAVMAAHHARQCSDLAAPPCGLRQCDRQRFQKVANDFSLSKSGPVRDKSVVDLTLLGRITRVLRLGENVFFDR
jgi:hypothetical protein